MTYRVIDTKTNEDITDKEEWLVTANGKLYRWDDCHETLQEAPEHYITSVEKQVSEREQTEQFRFKRMVYNGREAYVFAQNCYSHDEAKTSSAKWFSCEVKDVEVIEAYVEVKNGKTIIYEETTISCKPVYIARIIADAIEKYTFTEGGMPYKNPYLNGAWCHCVNRLKYNFLQARELAAFAFDCDEDDLEEVDSSAHFFKKGGCLYTADDENNTRCPVWLFKKKEKKTDCGRGGWGED